MKSYRLFKTIERLASKGWRSTMESTRRIMGLYTKVLLCVFGGLTKGHCLAIYAMSREIIRLYRRSGPLFVGQYLKQVAFLVQWYVGGDLSNRPKLKIFVSLTRSGIPKIIPPFYRKIIRMDKDPRVVQVVLSVCTLSRLMLVWPKGSHRISPLTIHDPHFQLSDTTKAFCKKLVSSAFSVLSAYAPAYRKTPLKLGFSFKPTFTSGPNTYKKPSRESSVLGAQFMDKLKLSIYHTLPIDATALMTLFTPEDLAHLGSLWCHDREIIPDSGYDAPIEPCREGTLALGWIINSLTLPAQKLWWDKMITRPEAGRFGRKLEGSGKIRVFAIANPLLQVLVRPLHDWVMTILSTLEMDGTYHQHLPLERLKGKRELFSFDLKSATDLLPVDLSGSLLVSLFGDLFGQSWCFLMTMVGFRSPEPAPKMKARVYRFTRGQPLGYYSSWPVFTLTHHMIVWMAAYEVYPRTLFKDYAILGDDIVIADAKVAKVYAKLMEDVQAVISKEKSLVSSKGACEFAKRFIIRNHREDRMDISPLSIPLIRLSSGFVSSFTFKKLGCSFQNSFRLRGGGYHVFSKYREGSIQIFNTLSRRWRRHWLAMHTPSGVRPLPISLWLAYPEKGTLSCYEIGLIRHFFLEKVKPRDISISSINSLRLFWEDDDFNMLERFLTSFVRQHLSYLSWYSELLFDYERSFEFILEPPVSPTKIERKSDENLVFRYGLMFKAWDFLRMAMVPQALPLYKERGNPREFIYVISYGIKRNSWLYNMNRQKQLGLSSVP